MTIYYFVILSFTPRKTACWQYLKGLTYWSLVCIFPLKTEHNIPLKNKKHQSETEAVHRFDWCDVKGKTNSQQADGAEAFTSTKVCQVHRKLEAWTAARSQVFAAEWIIAWFEVRYDALLAHERAGRRARPLFSILRWKASRLMNICQPA